MYYTIHVAGMFTFKLYTLYGFSRISTFYVKIISCYKRNPSEYLLHDTRGYFC